ncbi:MAG TPA: molybdopterin-dependent oxidoreductase, partial [Candidatus Limnocylindrales bacterium]|nr:molybdopterin-dependent oxidoreductase [Candidatus Limnocylindrales bacterium]
MGPTFGRGAMTNGWVDIKNTDMMLIMGGNPAENHPCGFKWPVEAKRTRNAKMIVVDPRFTRTAAVADMFCQIRAGSDIAFLGGVINYALQHDRVNKEYLVNYTNASFIIKKGFKLPEDGLYSGYDPTAMKYDVSTWNYEEGGNMTGTAAAAIAAGDGPATSDASHAAAVPVAMNTQSSKAAGPRGAEGQGIQGMGPGSAKGMPGKPGAAPALPPNVAYDTSL